MVTPCMQVEAARLNSEQPKWQPLCKSREVVMGSAAALLTFDTPDLEPGASYSFRVRRARQVALGCIGETPGMCMPGVAPLELMDKAKGCAAPLAPMHKATARRARLAKSARATQASEWPRRRRP